MAETKERDFKYLVIVESPAKSKTLTKILGKEYLVESSVGHIRDLPAKGLGIDVKKDFEPSYEVMSGKQKVVDKLCSLAKKADKVYLASDPDREGEAISWHLSHILNCKASKVSRITFNQITPDAVRNAVAHPREIDQHLVDAQQARRILDRLVGYKISPLLWRKIGGRSAGRVQSIAVRLICEREEEIQAFKAEEYWSVKAEVIDEKNPSSGNFTVALTHLDKKKITSPLDEADPAKLKVIRSEAEVETVAERIRKAKLAVTDINTRPGTKRPHAPFKTSTLQRAASNIGFTVKRTMQIAQELYEGVKLGGGDQVGLITYMRTDSLRLADEALDMARDYIVATWGNEYYPGEPTQYDKKKKNDDKKVAEQDAHEAIRPTYIEKTPDSIRSYLSPEQYKLYKLIWQRFVSSQMSAQKTETRAVEISSENADMVLRASETRTVFAGYAAVYGVEAEISEDAEEQEDSTKFPAAIAIGNPITTLEVNPRQHFTEGPPRYNEASLVRALEELGIGRPSTYAPTIHTIVDRKYVEKLNNQLVPTKLGINVNKLLVDHFGRFINVDFTSQMEANLDKIAEHAISWRDMLKDFYLGRHGKTKVTVKELKEMDEATLGFADIVKRASEEIESIVIPTEHKCPLCEAQMNLKSSRFGPFLGCSRYPECNGIVNLTKEGQPAPEDRPFAEACPDCKNSSLVIRHGRYGDYIACTTADCKYTSPLVKKTGVDCPREGCTGHIVEKKSRFGKMFYGCDSWSKTKCDTVFWYTPVKEHCPECNKLMMYKSLKRGDKVVCSDTKVCKYERLASAKDIERYKPVIDPAVAEAPKSVFSILD